MHTPRIYNTAAGVSVQYVGFRVLFVPEKKRCEGFKAPHPTRTACLGLCFRFATYIKSIFISLTSIGTLPVACAPSV